MMHNGYIQTKAWSAFVEVTAEFVKSARDPKPRAYGVYADEPAKSIHSRKHFYEGIGHIVVHARFRSRNP
jgi:hypothetical protein